MVKIRTAKQKGSCLEYDAAESLKPIFHDIYLTKQIGFQLQYDLKTDLGKAVFECKRLKAISWNQAETYLNKLAKVTPPNYKYYLLFKSNQQPCLIMYREDKQLTDIDYTSIIKIMKFEDYFQTTFVKHIPIKRVKLE